MFINPVVASGPQHFHMLAEPGSGCYVSSEQKVHCGKEPDRETNKNIDSTPFLEEFKPIPCKEEGQTKGIGTIKRILNICVALFLIVVIIAVACVVLHVLFCFSTIIGVD